MTHTDWDYVREEDLVRFCDDKLRSGWTIVTVQKTRRMWTRHYFVFFLRNTNDPKSV